jgi:hypothetical protein
VILNDLSTHLRRSEAVTREFVAQMDATFRRYADARNHFFQQIPARLHQSELVTLVNVEIKNRLLDPEFCEGLQDALKTLRRSLIRLEDLRAAHPDLPPAVNDLARLAALGERVEALYQRHREAYRYQGRLNEEELVGFLLEIDEVAYEWDAYLARLGAVNGIAQALSGRAIPAAHAVLPVAYRQDGPEQFSVLTLTALLNFLESGYRFVAAIFGTDPAAQPLTVLQVEVADPVRLQLAIPAPLEEPYRKLLQYLFLKDMLKREALLKFVFDATEKSFAGAQALTSAQINAFQKDLAAKLKPLPPGAAFTFADRSFPGDEILVLSDLTASLERAKVDYSPLLATGDKLKRPKATDAPKTAPKDDAQARLAEAASQAELKLQAAPGRPSAPPPLPGQPAVRQHIQVLTERVRE